MKYRNASDVLPDKVLREVQKYASGEALYIPAVGKRKKWGDGSGAKVFYRQRNEEIRLKYKQGATLEQLGEAYSLSEDTIRKIIYFREGTGCGTEGL